MAPSAAAAPAYGARAVPKLVGECSDTALGDVERRAALRAAWELLSHQETKERFVDEGLCEVAVALLEHPDTAMRMHAARIVGSLALSPRGLGRLLAGDTVALVCGLLQNAYAPTRQAAAVALALLSRTHAGCAAVSENGSATQILVGVLAETGNTVLVEQALVALKNLSMSEEGKLQTLKAFVMRQLKAICEAGDRSLLEAALDLCFSLLGHPDGKTALVNEGLAPIVVGCLGDASPNVCRLAAGCTMMLTVSTPGKAAIVDNNGIGALANLLRNSTDDNTKQNARLSLRHLAEMPSARTAIEAAVGKDLWA